MSSKSKKVIGAADLFEDKERDPKFYEDGCIRIRDQLKIAGPFDIIDYAHNIPTAQEFLVFTNMLFELGRFAVLKVLGESEEQFVKRATDAMYCAALFGRIITPHVVQIGRDRRFLAPAKKEEEKAKAKK